MIFPNMFDVDGVFTHSLNESKPSSLNEAKPNCRVWTDILKTPFYDEHTLDYLLKDIIKEKAQEAEKQLKKDIEKKKRENIDKYSNQIKQVLFNVPYTIILWKNGEKTIVKCQDEDVYDKEKGFALALVKHFFEDTNYFNTIFTKWIPKEEDK